MVHEMVLILGIAGNGRQSISANPQVGIAGWEHIVGRTACLSFSLIHLSAIQSG